MLYALHFELFFELCLDAITHEPPSSVNLGLHLSLVGAISKA